MQLRTALQQGLELLRKGQVSAPELTAEVLLCHALRCERVYIYSHPEHELTEIEWLHYGRYLHERLKGKPTQYVTRVQEFWGRDFHVEPGVLIPRPETEHVVEQALAIVHGKAAEHTTQHRAANEESGQCPDTTAPSRSRLRSGRSRDREGAVVSRPIPSGAAGNSVDSHADLCPEAPKGEVSDAAPLRILDIGTGSGILAVTLALETGAETCATDISSKALAIASANAARLGAHCRFTLCDLGAAFADGSFDVIVSNPPYIESSGIGTLQREVRDWEPHEALDGGPSGLDIYARLIPEAGRLLRPKGTLVLEIGAGQSKTVPALFDSQWRPPTVFNDLAGLARVVVARRA